MGTLFPDSDEHPDHHPIPSPLSRVVRIVSGAGRAFKVTTVGLPLALTAPFYGLCPAFEHHEEVPHHDTAPPASPVQALSAIGSTSANPFFGKTTDAADQVIRRWQTERHRLSHIASMPLGTNPALLFLNDSSSERST